LIQRLHYSRPRCPRPQPNFPQLSHQEYPQHLTRRSVISSCLVPLEITVPVPEYHNFRPPCPLSITKPINTTGPLPSPCVNRASKTKPTLPTPHTHPQYCTPPTAPYDQGYSMILNHLDKWGNQDTNATPNPPRAWQVSWFLFTRVLCINQTRTRRLSK